MENLNLVVTGGANILVLNYLLAPFGITFGDEILNADFFSDGEKVVMRQEKNIVKFPGDGYVHSFPFLDSSESGATQNVLQTGITKVSLVIEPKDKEVNSMYKQALELLSQALEVWPNDNVKFNYLEKLLSRLQPYQSKDPAIALAQGLDVMNKKLIIHPKM